MRISPDGSTSPRKIFTEITAEWIYTGPNHPLQFDTALNNWYLRVTAATSGDASVNLTTGYEGIHYHLGNESFYANSLFTGSSYTQRIADNRSSRDRTYRVRYVVDNATLYQEILSMVMLYNQETYPLEKSYGEVYVISTILKLRKNLRSQYKMVSTTVLY